MLRPLQLASHLTLALLGVLMPAKVNAQAVAPPDSRCIRQDPGRTCTLYSVSIIELIANPAAYDGKPVLLSGYIHFEFEGNGIYLHKEDVEHWQFSNGLWVSPADSFKRPQDCQDNYVTILGIFDATFTGHMGLWSGSVKEVSSCRKLRGVG
jgi:hypothetical protein